MTSYKQVIVMRTDLNMRKGKMVAQGAHAAVAASLSSSEDIFESWISQGMKKVCVGIGSEEELTKIAMGAQALGLNVEVIVDRGDTEFRGVPTQTCIAIGPDDSDLIDKVTGELKLL
jgi:PTH2 family peptidyl-tRNA hydrolase